MNMIPQNSKCRLKKTIIDIKRKSIYNLLSIFSYISYFQIIFYIIMVIIRSDYATSVYTMLKMCQFVKLQRHSIHSSYCQKRRLPSVSTLTQHTTSTTTLHRTRQYMQRETVYYNKIFKKRSSQFSQFNKYQYLIEIKRKENRIIKKAVDADVTFPDPDC